MNLGPVTVPLGAGEERNAEVSLSAFFPGQLTISATLTAGKVSDSDQATLTVIGGGSQPNLEDLLSLVEAIFDEIVASPPLAVEPKPWGSVKSLYR